MPQENQAAKTGPEKLNRRDLLVDRRRRDPDRCDTRGHFAICFGARIRWRETLPIL